MSKSASYVKNQCYESFGILYLVFISLDFKNKSKKLCTVAFGKHVKGQRNVNIQFTKVHYFYQINNQKFVQFNF